MKKIYLYSIFTFLFAILYISAKSGKQASMKNLDEEPFLQLNQSGELIFPIHIQKSEIMNYSYYWLNPDGNKHSLGFE